jgi:hypothetical protein
MHNHMCGKNEERNHKTRMLVLASSGGGLEHPGGGRDSEGQRGEGHEAAGGDAARGVVRRLRCRAGRRVRCRTRDEMGSEARVSRASRSRKNV